MEFYKSKLFIISFIVLALIIFFIWQNNDIVTSDIVYVNENIPKEFQDFNIIHISDLHNKTFGGDQKKLLVKILDAQADIIVITGDLVDRRRYDLEKAMLFIEGAVKLAPVYYVSGNHEAWSGEYETIKMRLIDTGVNVLDNEKIDLVRNGETIEIIGLQDPAFLTSSYMDRTDMAVLEATLKELSKTDRFQILLSHRPELFSIYSDYNIDLSFTGHAHGGQFRIPGLGGLVAPDQGLFPQYTSGSHTIDRSTMIVSRGLGNSIIPVRIFNRPEIVKVTLRTK